MDPHESFTGIDAFRSGLPMPLLLPEPVRDELTSNACFEDPRRALEAEYGHRAGYPFPWGQIREQHLDPGPDAGSDAPVIEWHFVLSALHAEFLGGGGTLGELSDVCLELLERIETQAREERFDEALPLFLSFGDGDALSAFSIIVSGPENLGAARTWVGEVFVPEILPLIVASVRDINTEDRPADQP